MYAGKAGSSRDASYRDTKKHNLSIELTIRFVYYYLSGSCDPLSLSLQTRPAEFVITDKKSITLNVTDGRETCLQQI